MNLICWRASALATVVLLGGCASFSPDGGFAPVAQTARQTLGKDLIWSRTPADQDRIDQTVAALLAQPLSADAAVQIALLNNRGLQARFADLGITEAEVVQAGRLPNPGLSFGRLTRGSEVEIETSLHFNLARLLVLPFTRPLESRRFEQQQTAVAQQVLALAADTRRAWVMALSAQESVVYLRQVQQAANSGFELARRMEAVGNFNKLQRAREQGFAQDAAMNLARAEQAQRATRERLVRLLGLGEAQIAFQLPERLPDLPKTVREQPDIARTALAQRLDVQAERLAVQQTAANLGLSRSTRFINVLELGAVRNRSNEAPVLRGWEVALELPLFDFGNTRVVRAEAVYMQALHRAAEVAVNARSEVREAYTAYRSAWDIARYQQDEVVPLRKQVSEENLLRYNGMLIGVFELLADARAQIASVHAAIEARRDFWLAQADLDMAIVGKPALAAPAGRAAASDTPAGGH